MVKCTGRGLVVKRPGVLSKVQMLTLVLGVGVFSPLPIVEAVLGSVLLPLLLDEQEIFCAANIYIQQEKIPKSIRWVYIALSITAEMANHKADIKDY